MLCEYVFVLISGVEYGAASDCPQWITMIILCCVCMCACACACVCVCVIFARCRKFTSRTLEESINRRAQRARGSSCSPCCQFLLLHLSLLDCWVLDCWVAGLLVGDTTKMLDLPQRTQHPRSAGSSLKRSMPLFPANLFSLQPSTRRLEGIRVEHR
jgi:hypothetical protein